MYKRKRRIGSVKEELLQKAREAMLTSVQVFNNPNIVFKSESFIVLAIISWTYLLHAYFRKEKIDYRYFQPINGRKKYDKTKHGGYKYWELERCLNEHRSPIDKITSWNLRFLIGLRHEIEHQMTTKIDDLLSARFQACCLNFNMYLKKLFGDKFGIEKYLSFSLQFSSLDEKQVSQLRDYADLPKNISAYIGYFDENLPEKEFNDSKFSYRVLFVPKTVNRKGQADRVIEFVDPKSPMTQGLSKVYWATKDREKPKHLPSKIVREMQELGYKNFKQYQHTKLWQKVNGKNPAKGYGVQIEKTWYCNDSWFEYVKNHCEKNKTKYI